MRIGDRLGIAPVLLYLRKLRAFAGRKLYVNLFGTIAVSLLEGIGILLLAPMLSLIGLLDISAGGIPFLASAAEPLQRLPDDWQLPAVLFVFVVLLLGQGLLQRHLTNRNSELEQGFIRHLRMDLYKGLLQAEWAFYLRRRKSDFINHATTELPRVSFGVFLFLQLATTLLFTAIQIGLALLLSAQLTVAVLLCGLALAVFSRSKISKSRTIGQETTELMQRYVAGMTDHLGGIKDIKSNGLEKQHLTWFGALCDRLERNIIQFSRLQSASRFRYKAASTLLIAGFVYFSFAVLHVQAEILLLIVMIFSRLWPKFSALQSGMEQLAQTIPAFRTLGELQRETGEAREPEMPEAGGKVRVVQGFELRDVSYRYDRRRDDYALRSVSMRIPAERMTAIVGKSGAGKSTLIDLLIGLVQPECGQVLADGMPLGAEESNRLRRSVSYVSQDPFLFHESVRDNLLIAAPGASEDRMWEALRFASAEAFVKKLPQGLDTMLGDRGVRLSGGERQRIVLARAILREPSILILDEATSALDGEHEALIQEALDRLRGSMTIIVIAHRLSTIRGADQIIVLDKGTIVQRGGYAQLAAQNEGLFGRLLGYHVG